MVEARGPAVGTRRGECGTWETQARRRMRDALRSAEGGRYHEICHRGGTNAAQVRSAQILQPLSKRTEACLPAPSPVAVRGARPGAAPRANQGTWVGTRLQVSAGARIRRIASPHDRTYCPSTFSITSSTLRPLAYAGPPRSIWLMTKTSLPAVSRSREGVVRRQKPKPPSSSDPALPSSAIVCCRHADPTDFVGSLKTLL